MPNKDEQYLETFLLPLRKCKSYRPKFGRGGPKKGVSVDEFKLLYGSDPFYSWVGLDSALMYATHRAAGGMTSVYRQLGIGCERLFREILIDAANYRDAKFARWSYTAKTRSGKSKKLSLDGRLELSEIKNQTVLADVKRWIEVYCSRLGGVAKPSGGIVFEVRQGYKSKDSKRQHADIDNATIAWANDYFPVFAIFSSQIDSDVALRYQNHRCGMLVGTISDDEQQSLYAFCKNVLDYDLAGFFKRQTSVIKSEVNSVIETILSAD